MKEFMTGLRSTTVSLIVGTSCGLILAENRLKLQKLHFLEMNENHLEQTKERLIPLQYNV